MISSNNALVPFFLGSSTSTVDGDPELDIVVKLGV
jgi:hypothetical protein